MTSEQPTSNPSNQYGIPHRKYAGFTLVEILIVVAILGILAAIAIPQFTKYRVSAAVARAHADLRNCMAEITSAEAVNGTTISMNCTKMPGNRLGQCILVMYTGNGSLELTQPCSNEYNGHQISCDVLDNRARCRPAP